MHDQSNLNFFLKTPQLREYQNHITNGILGKKKIILKFDIKILREAI